MIKLKSTSQDEFLEESLELAIKNMRNAGYELQNIVSIEVDPELQFMGYAKIDSNKSSIVVADWALDSDMLNGLILHELAHIMTKSVGHTEEFWNNFRYLLKQTSLMLILDKNLLLKKIEKLKAKFLNEKYYLFNMENNGNLINIFFDKNSYDLIGWQTEDIYQNLVVTYIFNVKKNSKVDKKIFKLPEAH